MQVQGKLVLGSVAISFAVRWSPPVRYPLLSNETEGFVDFSIRLTSFEYFIR
jgi:hypothetical protein